MNPERFQRISDLFETARRLAVADRGVYLADACGDDTALREAVEDLMGHHDDDTEFLTESVARQPMDDPERIGDYRIVRPLGEGGMGRVYLAEQQEPIKRQVALKLIKIGMDTREVVGRFGTERQALALMEHPNIARVLDAGATEEGRPFFVMEYVDGELITEFCDRKRLVMRDRLRLFIDVCRAIQHAHQRGIIHRDIKPSNVLVTEVDGRAIPKVIDFGIAKAMRDGAVGKTAHTVAARAMGTPAYMSPEQVSGKTDIDTRTDIFSLGALLYELLCGSTPIDAGRLRSESLSAVYLAILREDPPRPSRRLDDASPGLANEMAARRGTDARGLRRRLRTDLDWIALKALDKARARRYPTAAAFADDVLRHLDHETVIASPPDLANRAAKFYRRHRIGLTAGTIAVLALLIGLGAAVRDLVRARDAEAVATLDAGRARDAEQRERKERVKAEAGRKRAMAMLNLVSSMFSAADPQQMKGPGYTVEELLDDFDETAWPKVADTPVIEAALRTIVGLAYEGLGAFDEAEVHLRRTLDLVRNAHGDRHGRTARAKIDLGWLLRFKEEYGAAQALLVEARDTLEALHPDGHRDFVVALRDLAEVLRCQQRYAAAEAHARRALAMARRVFDEATMSMAERLTIVHVLSTVSAVMRDQFREDEAIAFAEERLALTRRAVGDRHPMFSLAASHLADLIAETESRQEEAVRLAEQAVEVTSLHYPEAHPRTIDGLVKLGTVLRRCGHHRRAGPILERAYELASAPAGSTEQRLTITNAYGVYLLETGQARKALPLLERAAKENAERHGDGYRGTISARSNLAHALMNLGQTERAEPLLAATLATRERQRGPKHETTLGSMNDLANARARLGRTEEAVALLEQTIERARDENDAVSRAGLIAMNNLAAIVRKLGQRKRALALFEEVYRVRVKRYGPEHAETIPSLINLGDAYSKERRYDRAIAFLETAVRATGRHFVAHHPTRLTAMKNLGTAYYRKKRYKEAVPLFERVCELRRKTRGMADRRVQFDFMWLAEANAKAGNLEMAIRVSERTLIAARALDRRKRIDLDYDLYTLAGIYNAAKRYADAERVLRECTARHDGDGDGPITRAQTNSRLGVTLMQLGRDTEAEPLLKDGATVLLKSKTTSAPVRDRARRNIVSFYEKQGDEKSVAFWRDAYRRTAKK